MEDMIRFEEMMSKYEITAFQNLLKNDKSLSGFTGFKAISDLEYVKAESIMEDSQKKMSDMQCFTVRDLRKKNIWSICDMNVDFGGMYFQSEVSEESSIMIVHRSLKLKMINYAKLSTDLTEFNDTVEVENDNTDEQIKMWSYDSEAEWPEQCKMGQQSPIDIKSAEVKGRTKLI